MKACINLLRGTKNKDAPSYWHDLDGVGAAKGTELGEVERLFHRLVVEQALQEYSVMNKSGFPVDYIRVSFDLHVSRRTLLIVSTGRSDNTTIHSWFEAHLPAHSHLAKQAISCCETSSQGKEQEAQFRRN